MPFYLFNPVETPKIYLGVHAGWEPTGLECCSSQREQPFIVNVRDFSSTAVTLWFQLVEKYSKNIKNDKGKKLYNEISSRAMTMNLRGFLT